MAGTCGGISASQSPLRPEAVHLPSEVEETLQLEDEPEQLPPTPGSAGWFKGGSEVDHSLTLGVDWAAPCWTVLGLRFVRAVGLCVRLCAYTWLNVGVSGLHAQHPFPNLNQALPLPPSPNLLGLPFLFSHRLCTRPFRIKTLILQAGEEGVQLSRASSGVPLSGPSGFLC